MEILIIEVQKKKNFFFFFYFSTLTSISMAVEVSILFIEREPFFISSPASLKNGCSRA